MTILSPRLWFLIWLSTKETSALRKAWIYVFSGKCTTSHWNISLCHRARKLTKMKGSCWHRRWHERAPIGERQDNLCIKKHSDYHWLKCRFSTHSNSMESPRMGPAVCIFTELPDGFSCVPRVEAPVKGSWYSGSPGHSQCPSSSQMLASAF